MKKASFIIATLTLFSFSLYFAFMQGDTGTTGQVIASHLAAPEMSPVVYTGLRAWFAEGFSTFFNALVSLTGNHVFLAIVLLAFLVELVLLYPSVSIQLKQKKIHIFHKKLVDKFTKGDLKTSATQHELHKLYAVNEKMHARGALYVAAQLVVFLSALWGLNLLVHASDLLSGTWQMINVSLLSKPVTFAIPLTVSLLFFLHSMIKVYLKEREDYISPQQTMFAIGFAIVSSAAVYFFSQIFASALSLYFVSLITFATVRYVIVEQHARQWGKHAHKELVKELKLAEKHKDKFELISRKWNHLPVVRHINFHLLEEAASMSLGLLIALNFFGAFNAPENFRDGISINLLTQVESAMAYTDSCGDDIVNELAHETCDDGNQVNGDGCNYACLIEGGWGGSAPVWSEKTILIMSDLPHTPNRTPVDSTSTYMVIGNPFYYQERGIVRIYKKNPDNISWSLQASLNIAGIPPGFNFGQSVAIHKNVIVVGAKKRVYVYINDGSSWNKVGQLDIADGHDDSTFGNAVDIYKQSNDVVTIVVGDQGANNHGEGFVYETQNINVATPEWVRTDFHIYDDPVCEVGEFCTLYDYQFGHSVSIVADKVAFSENKKSHGYVHIYDKDNPDTIINTVSSDDLGIQGYLGSEIDMNEKYLVVSAEGRYDYEGEIYIYDVSNYYAYVDKIASPSENIDMSPFTLTNFQEYGVSVSIDNNHNIIVGSLSDIEQASNNDIDNVNVALLYLYDDDEPGWEYSDVFFDRYPDSNDGLRTEVDLYNNFAFLASRVNDSNGKVSLFFENNLYSGTCGDEIINFEEGCDDGNSTAGDGCSNSCELDTCGNDILDTGEDCDGEDLGGLFCDSSGIGYYAGTLNCADDCTYDVSSCTNCGNDLLDDESEQCDGSDVGSLTCISEGFERGDLSCTNDCSLVIDGCSSCGDEEVNAPDETCDGGPDCRDNCTKCGDDIKDAGEACDDGELNGTEESDCSTICALKTCGNNIVEDDEDCDDGGLCSVGGALCSTVTLCDEGECLFSNEDSCLNTCVNATCGDLQVWSTDGGAETCDDGNGINSDSCLNDICIEAVCGDGYLEVGVEACDDGGVCSNNTALSCTTLTADTDCNDGSATCNAVSGDGCSYDCSTVDSGYECPVAGESCTLLCGNDIINGDETCDDGVSNSDDTPNACRMDCTLPFCGDGIEDSGEECDDDVSNSDDTPNACRMDCTLPFCGDGIEDADEACDDGNNSNADECLNTCEIAECGDGETWEGEEECDDENQINTDACVGCKYAKCGDTFTFSGVEECDDGKNGDNNDNCLDTCMKADCGDGYVWNSGDGTEDCDFFSCLSGAVCTDDDCDDGSECMFRGDNESCDYDCSFAICGDLYINEKNGEYCDDGYTCQDGYYCASPLDITSCVEHDDGTGNTTCARRDTNECDRDCSRLECGDGYSNKAAIPPEQCEYDPLLFPTCSQTSCSWLAPVCGNGVLDYYFVDGVEYREECELMTCDGEPCDVDTHGDSCGIAGDTCDIHPPVEQTASCTSQCTNSICGDGITNLEDEESCDDGIDGTPTDTENCDSDCTEVECGDNHTNEADGEECDGWDNCSSTCTLIADICGNNRLDPGEECDGILPDPDRKCDLDCTWPICGDGITNLDVGEECDPGTGGNPLETKQCTTQCKFSTCGDHVINATANETCDPGTGGNPLETGTCDLNCTDAECGDYTKNVSAGEECDDGAVDSSICNFDCTDAVCGDGYKNVVAGEACDNGRHCFDTTTPCDENSDCEDQEGSDKSCFTRSNNGCSAACAVEPGYTCTGDHSVCSSNCGDSMIAGGEVCDLGTVFNNIATCPYANQSCMVCLSNCSETREGTTSFCGDGVTDSTNGEICDDGGMCSGDFSTNCSSNNDCKTDNGPCDGTGTCTEDPDTACEVAGDCIISKGICQSKTELCEYGDLSCTICKADCTWDTEPASKSYCGDGIVDYANGEECEGVDGCNPLACTRIGIQNCPDYAIPGEEITNITVSENTNESYTWTYVTENLTGSNPVTVACDGADFADGEGACNANQTITLDLPGGVQNYNVLLTARQTSDTAGAFRSECYFTVYSELSVLDCSSFGHGLAYTTDTGRGEPATKTATAAGGTPPYTWDLSTGVGSLDAATGEYTVDGDHYNEQATLRVTDANAHVADCTFTISYDPIEVKGIPNFFLGCGEQQLEYTGGPPDGNVIWSLVDTSDVDDTITTDGLYMCSLDPDDSQSSIEIKVEDGYYAENTNLSDTECSDYTTSATCPTGDGCTWSVSSCTGTYTGGEYYDRYTYSSPICQNNFGLYLKNYATDVFVPKALKSHDSVASMNVIPEGVYRLYVENEVINGAYNVSFSSDTPCYSLDTQEMCVGTGSCTWSSDTCVSAACDGLNEESCVLPSCQWYQIDEATGVCDDSEMLIQSTSLFADQYIVSDDGYIEIEFDGVSSLDEVYMKIEDSVLKDIYNNTTPTPTDPFECDAMIQFTLLGDGDLETKDFDFKEYDADDDNYDGTEDASNYKYPMSDDGEAEVSVGTF